VANQDQNSKAHQKIKLMIRILCKKKNKYHIEVPTPDPKSSKVLG